MGEYLILNRLNSDFSFVMEVGALLSCFVYFWFQVISQSVIKIKCRSITKFERRVRPVYNLGRMYKGMRASSKHPLEKFHLINERLKVGSAISAEHSYRKTA